MTNQSSFIQSRSQAASNPSNATTTNSAEKKELVAASYKSTIKSIGVEKEGVRGIQISDWNYTIPFVFTNGKFDEKSVNVQFPKFKFSLDIKEPGNYANSFERGCIIDGQIQHTDDKWFGKEREKGTETKAIDFYFRPLIEYFIQCMEVFADQIKAVQESEVGGNYDNMSNRDIAKKFTYLQLRKCELLSSKYITYGVMDGTEWYMSDFPAPTQNEHKRFIGKVNDEEVQLIHFEDDGLTTFVYMYDRSLLMTNEEQLAFLNTYVNEWAQCFLNTLVDSVVTYNKGQEGYIPKAWVCNTKKDGTKTCYYNIVNTLKSLIISIGSVKVDDKWINVTREEAANYQGVKFRYGNMCGLSWQEAKLNDTESRYQFIFKATPHRFDVEGTDTTVEMKYRNDFKNPLLLLSKPVETNTNSEVGEVEKVVEKAPIKLPVVTDEELADLDETVGDTVDDTDLPF